MFIESRAARGCDHVECRGRRAEDATEAFGKIGRVGNMKKRIRPTLAAAAVLLLPLVFISACSSAANQPEDPYIEQLGEFVYRYSGTSIIAVLGYEFAVQSIGDEWLILEFAGSTPARTRTRIQRQRVFVRAPDGARLAMATQRDFSRAFARLRPKLRRANIMRDPMFYFSGNHVQCGLDFFAEPGRSLTFDEVSLNDRRACEGKILFMVPGGVHSGRWVFEIDLDEESVRIPFQL